MTLENGTKLIQHQVAEIPSTITREITDADGTTMRMVSEMFFRHYKSSLNISGKPFVITSFS